MMNNFGFISKRKVAKEIGRVYLLHEPVKGCGNEELLRCYEAQSALNALCTRLGIKPMHLNKLGGGTNEIDKLRKMIGK